VNNYDDIPKNQLVYLERAYHEFANIKENYLRWVEDINAQMEKMSPEDAKRFKADPKVPELSVKVPLDDGEGAQIENEEW